MVGDTAPTCVRPQVFSTSRRFTPPTALRAYFIPVALMGFLPLRGFPSLDAEHLSAGQPLLTLAPEGSSSGD